MKSVYVHNSSEAFQGNGKPRLISLKDKLEVLRSNIDETQKYELLTTNQYLKHIELVVVILEDFSKFIEHEQRLIGGENE